MAVFKGATMATVNVPFLGEQSFLYVADFRNGRVQIYDSSFTPVPQMEELFVDDQLPAGFAPFNVQNIGGNIFVSFAMQDSDKHDEVDGAGLGYVDIFSPEGHRLRRLEHGPWFNAPWGLTQASSDFGSHSHEILVGQFSSGEILAFNAITGRFKGRLRDAPTRPSRLAGCGGWDLEMTQPQGRQRLSSSPRDPTTSKTVSSVRLPRLRTYKETSSSC